MRDTEGARSDAELSRKEVRTHPHPSHVTHTSCSPPQALEANAIAAKAVELAKAADSAKTELKETRSELERTRAKLSQATNKAKQVDAMAQRYEQRATEAETTAEQAQKQVRALEHAPVSYTHLTLPTKA